MRKLFLCFVLLGCFTYASATEGSKDKGLTYFKFLFKKELGYDGSVFTAKHTEAEWKELFKDDAKGFKKEFSGLTQNIDNLLKSDKFKIIAPHIEAFAIYYAKDSGYSPHCGNNDIDNE